MRSDAADGAIASGIAAVTGGGDSPLALRRPPMVESHLSRTDDRISQGMVHPLEEGACAVIDEIFRMVDRLDAHFLVGDEVDKPSAIADEVFHVAHQDRCAWSFNVELQPDIENW